MVIAFRFVFFCHGEVLVLSEGYTCTRWCPLMLVIHAGWGPLMLINVQDGVL